MPVQKKSGNLLKALRRNGKKKCGYFKQQTGKIAHEKTWT